MFSRKISSQIYISEYEKTCYRGYSFDSSSLYHSCPTFLYMNMMDNGLASQYNVLLSIFYCF